MTDWVVSSTLDAWVADLGVVTYLPGPPAADIMPPADVCGGINYLIAATTIDDIVTQTWSWVGTNAYNADRFFDDTVGVLFETGVHGDPPTGTPWHLFVVFEGPFPDYHALAEAPTVTPESLAPPVGPAYIPPEEARPTVALYDVDGSPLVDLPLAAGIQWQTAVDAVGGLSLRLPLDDADTALATSLRILKVSWRGGARQAARIDSSSTDVEIAGRMWRQWSNLLGIRAVLAGVPVYPEYRLNRASSSQRTLGFMTREGDGAWLASGNFTAAVGVAWSALTGSRAGYPVGLDFSDPQWIAKRGPYHNEPANSYQYLRKQFETVAAMDVRVLATADNYIDLWLDGERIIESGGQTAATWHDMFEVSQRLPAGAHVLAARIRNSGSDDPNPMGLLCTMQRLDSSGNPVDETPVVNSDSSWDVSDIAPGFRRAEVLLRLWEVGNFHSYAACALLPLAFTATLDTAGDPWADDPGEYTLDIGSSLLDVITALTEKGIDVMVDPESLTVQAWSRRGSDLRETVILARGVDGGNLISHQVEEIDPTVNTVLIQLADGRWDQRQNSAALAVNGREGIGLSVGSTSDTASAYEVADAQLAESSRRSVKFTTQVASQVGPQIYVDFDLGDTISVPDEAGTGTYAARLLAVTVDASVDGPVQVTPELMLDTSADPVSFDSGDAGDPYEPSAGVPVWVGGSGGGTGADSGAGVGVGILPTESAPASDYVVSPGDLGAIAAAPEGATVVFNSGLYRLAAGLVPKAGQTWWLADDADVRGSATLSSWVGPDGSGRYYVAGALPAKYADPGVCEVISGSEANPCQKREWLFRDGTHLTRFMVLSDLAPGGFYADYDANRVYIREDPTGHTYELSRTQYAINTSVDGFTLRGGSIRHFATPAQAGAVSLAGDGNTVLRTIFAWNHSLPIHLVQTADFHARYVQSLYNGQLGFGHYRSTSTLIEDCEFGYNNTDGFWGIDWEAGGFKFTYSGLTMKRNWIHGNKGVGAWGDIDNKGYVLGGAPGDGNLIEDNYADGSRIEISFDGEVSYNTIRRNGFGTVFGGARGSDYSLFAVGGVNVNTSTRVRIHHNNVWNNANGVVLQARARGASSTYHVPRDLAGCEVDHNNIAQQITVVDGHVTGLRAGEGVSGIRALAPKLGSNYDLSTQNNFHDNTYILGDTRSSPIAQAGAARFAGWNGTAQAYMNFTDWQATGQDSGSTVTVSNTSVT